MIKFNQINPIKSPLGQSITLVCGRLLFNVGIIAFLQFTAIFVALNDRSSFSFQWGLFVLGTLVFINLFLAIVRLDSRNPTRHDSVTLAPYTLVSQNSLKLTTGSRIGSQITRILCLILHDLSALISLCGLACMQVRLAAGLLGFRDPNQHRILYGLTGIMVGVIYALALYLFQYKSANNSSIHQSVQKEGAQPL